MYVCICKAVNERQIAEAMANGITTVSGLRQHLGLGTGCGRCLSAARDYLAGADDGADTVDVQTVQLQEAS